MRKPGRGKGARDKGQGARGPQKPLSPGGRGVGERGKPTQAALLDAFPYFLPLSHQEGVVKTLTDCPRAHDWKPPPAKGEVWRGRPPQAALRGLRPLSPPRPSPSRGRELPFSVDEGFYDTLLVRLSQKGLLALVGADLGPRRPRLPAWCQARCAPRCAPTNLLRHLHQGRGAFCAAACMAEGY